MAWKSEYLANLIRLIESDEVVGNREFLLLIELEKRIQSKIEDYVEASSQAAASGDMQRMENELLDREHLKHLYMMAMADSQICEAEQRMIDRFVAASRIPPHRVAQIREQAGKELARILRAASRPDPG